MKIIEEYSTSELVSLGLALSFIIAEKSNLEQQNVLGNLIQDIGQAILLIAAQNQSIQDQEVTPSGVDETIVIDLQKQIDELKEYVEKLKDNNFKNQEKQ